MQIKDAFGINNNKPLERRDPALEVGRSGARAAQAATQDGQKGATDTVELSGKSRELAKAHEAVANTPSLRAQKIAEIKARIENNEYQVESEQVANKMIVDFLGELV